MTNAAAPLGVGRGDDEHGLALAGYQLRLPSFEGPLDVLLRLIEREQLVITDVSLVSVADQFLAHLASIQGVPAETIAEFAAVAGRLVLLKSRSLMPRPAVAEEAEPEGLVRQLEQYRALRVAIDRLAAGDVAAEGAFARGSAVERPAPAPPRLAPQSASLLGRALRRRLTNAAAAPRIVGVTPILTLREMAERLLARLPGDGRAMVFRAERGGSFSRQELLVGFLAILALVRRRVVDAEQGELFGEIMLRRSHTSEQRGKG